MINLARSLQVIIRIAVRLALLCAIAALGSVGFTRMLSGLLLMWAVLCAFIAGTQKERPLDVVLTSWDEAAFYGLLFCLITIVNQGADF